MIHIEQDQEITENKNLRVKSITGDYEDNALIEFYDINDPEKITGAFASQFVKYGGLVYRFNDPKELGVEILKIDPESTHSAASFVRMQNELLKQFNQGSLEPESLSQVQSEEQSKMEEQITNPIDSNASTTPATSEVVDNTITQPVNNSTNNTSTNSVNSTTTNANNSTSTDQIVQNILDTTNQTTTPPINPEVAGVSTSTAQTTTTVPEIINTTSTPYDPTSTIPVNIDTTSTTSSVIENEIINNATSTSS